MKVLPLLAALVFWAGATESGFARISCHNAYERCLTDPKANAEKCKTLYDASLKEGGVWGSPAARAAAHASGSNKVIFCMPE